VSTTQVYSHVNAQGLPEKIHGRVQAEELQAVADELARQSNIPSRTRPEKLRKPGSLTPTQRPGGAQKRFSRKQAYCGWLLAVQERHGISWEERPREAVAETPTKPRQEWPRN